MEKALRMIALKAFIVFFALGAIGIYSSQGWAIDSAVKQVRGPTWVPVPTTGKALQSITVTPRANGFVTVTVTGTMNYNHTYGTPGYYCLDLHNVADYVGGCIPASTSDTAIRSHIPSEFPTTKRGYGTGDPYSIVRTWKVTGGTSYTFYLNGYANDLGSVYLFHPTITAIYTPKRLP